jgi:hypothetical protein
LCAPAAPALKWFSCTSSSTMICIPWVRIMVIDVVHQPVPCWCCRCTQLHAHAALCLLCLHALCLLCIELALCCWLHFGILTLNTAHVGLTHHLSLLSKHVGLTVAHSDSSHLTPLPACLCAL